MRSRTPVFHRLRQKGQKVIDILTYRANMRDLAYIKKMCVWRGWGRRINRVPFKDKLSLIRSLGPFCKFPSSCNRTQLGLNQKHVDLCEHSWFSIACGNVIFVEMWCSHIDEQVLCSLLCPALCVDFVFWGCAEWRLRHHTEMHSLCKYGQSSFRFFYLLHWLRLQEEYWRRV